MMEYASARALIKSGDLLAFSHRRSMFASFYDFKIALVRMFTKSEYSHVGLAWVIGGRVFVLEAVVPKVRIFPLSKCGDFYLIKTGAGWMPETEELALWKVGEDYSQVQALKAFFDDLPEGDVSECAAYVRHVLRKDGIDLGNRAVPDSIVLRAQMLPNAITIHVTNAEN